MCVVVGTTIVAHPTDDASYVVPSFRPRRYCEATDEMDRARSLLAAPMSSKSTVSEQMAAQLGLAFLASRAEGIDDGPAAALAGIASSAQALAASAKAPLRTGASGLVQAVAAMARGAHADGVAILEKALHRLNKSIGKKAYAIALMLMGECLCGGDIDTTNTSVANEQDVRDAPPSSLVWPVRHPTPTRGQCLVPMHAWYPGELLCCLLGPVVLM